MATTVEQFCRSMLASMDTDAGFLNCVKWTDERYRELCSRFRPRHLRKIGEVYLNPDVSTGTVTVTSGTTAVTGTSTTWATLPTTTCVATNWYFRTDAVWYQVAAFSSNTELTLSTSFVEPTVTTGSYNLVQRFHSLSTGARWLGDFVNTRLRYKIDSVNMGQLDREAPGRMLISYPQVVAQQGVDSSGAIQVEFYPYADNPELIHYIYWDAPAALTIASTLPLQIDPYVLKEGVLIDLYRYMKARALDNNKVDVAAVYRNDEQAQRSRWENAIQQAHRADKGMDDTTFILKHFGTPTPGQDVVTARDEVYIRGNRSW